MFKLVICSNFDKDWYNEVEVNLPHMRNEHYAKELCALVNSICYNNPNSEHICCVKPADYVPHIGIHA